MINSSYYQYVEEVESHDSVRIVIAFSDNIENLDKVDYFAEEVVDECTWAYNVNEVDIDSYSIKENKINAEFTLHASGMLGYTPAKITGEPDSWFPAESESDFEEACEVDDQGAFNRIDELIKRYNYDISIYKEESYFEEPDFDNNIE